MNTETPKTMIVVSVQKKDGKRQIIFEKEPYYSDHNRRIYTEFHVDILDPHLLLRDQHFKEQFGFTICVYLANRHRDGVSDLVTNTQLIYPHFRINTPVLRIDEERYLHKSSRQYCDQLSMPEGSAKAICRENKAFHLELAEKVLKHLDMNEELCMQKDKDIVPDSPETFVPLTTHSYT